MDAKTVLQLAYILHLPLDQAWFYALHPENMSDEGKSTDDIVASPNTLSVGEALDVAELERMFVLN